MRNCECGRTSGAPIGSSKGAAPVWAVMLLERDRLCYQLQRRGYSSGKWGVSVLPGEAYTTRAPGPNGAAASFVASTPSDDWVGRQGLAPLGERTCEDRLMSPSFGLQIRRCVMGLGRYLACLRKSLTLLAAIFFIVPLVV